MPINKKHSVSVVAFLLSATISFGETNSLSPSVESAIRQCLLSIIDDVVILKGTYPELVDFSPTDAKTALGPKPMQQWSMSFNYEHHYQAARGKLKSQVPVIGDRGCSLGVEFRKLTVLDQRVETLKLPRLKVKVFVTCELSNDSSPKLKHDFSASVMKHLFELKDKH